MLALALVAVSAVSFVSAKQALTPRAYANSLSVDAIFAHLTQFQAFANASGNTRTHGSTGYTASADYVAKIAQDADLDVHRQGTTSPVGFIDVGTLTVGDLTLPFPNVTVDFYTNVTQPGGFTGELVHFPGDGCTEEEWVGTEDKVVLVKNGGCEISLKTFNGRLTPVAILYDETPQPPVPGIGIRAYPPGTIVVPVTFNADFYSAQAIIQKLASGPVTATAHVDIHVEDVASDNVIAQTKWGDQNKVIMIGAHLDSVPDGPGINDNGSGSATVAELVKQLRSFKPGKHALRFGWWSTEEAGLLGSTFYVEQLPQKERDKIVAYINLDMTASPNYVLGVQDNDNSGGNPRPPWVPEPPVGSNALEKILQNAFVDLHLNYTGFAVALNSDHGSFLQAGIVMGGLATGAAGRKTAIEAELFGGIAGDRYDNCYHSICDTVDNISREALIQNGRVAARALALLANDISAIKAEQAAGKVSAARVTPDHSTNLGKHESH